MNLERFEFKTIDVEPFQVKEVLGTLLHSIVFNRALGSISPKEIDCEALEGISYVS